MSKFDPGKYDRELAAEVRKMFHDGTIASWARTACAALPEEAKAWDRRGGVWVCVFQPPPEFADPRGHLAVMRPFVGGDLFVDVAFELETEADLAGWAWTRMLHEKFGLLAFERDPLGPMMPKYVRAEWFPSRSSARRAAHGAAR